MVSHLPRLRNRARDNRTSQASQGREGVAVKKVDDVFLRAAELIDCEKSYYSCCAIPSTFNTYSEGVSEKNKYRGIFKPRGTSEFWGKGWDDEGEYLAKQRRVLALLFAHQMRQTGDL